MIRNKKYFMIVCGVLVLVVSVGPFARPHQVLNNNAVAVASIRTSSEAVSINNETSFTKDELKDEKNAEIINYTVKAGDTVDSVASLYGVNASTVAESNGIAASDSLQEGQTLRFPSINGLLHKVNDTETLWDIAMAYKIDMNELIKINSLKEPDKLKLDQEIIIPRADKLLAVNDNSSDNLAAKADGSNTTLSRGGSVSKAIKASSAIITWPLNGPITSGFGLRSRDNHTGIDIAASIGTPIKAACDGEVVFNGWQDGYGKLLIIQASNGIQTYYGHTSAILVNVGQTVSRGQVVAKVGMTGRTTGPHVHFEVRKDGIPQNPLNYLK